MNITLIEDDPDCYESFRELLEARGHVVKLYEEADSAVRDIVSIAASDVVVLDLMIQLGSKIMPDEARETGIAIYKRIRRIDNKVRIVVITARSKADIWDAFKDDPKVAFMEKPMSDVEEFYRTIEEA